MTLMGLAGCRRLCMSSSIIVRFTVSKAFLRSNPIQYIVISAFCHRAGFVLVITEGPEDYICTASVCTNTDDDQCSF